MPQVYQIFQQFSYANDFKMRDIINLLKKKPELMKINYNIKKKQNLL